MYGEILGHQTGPPFTKTLAVSRRQDPMSSRIRDFFSAFLNEAKNAFSFTSSLEILDENDLTLVLKSGSKQLIVDKRLRAVKSGAQILTLFDTIETIDLKHHRNGADDPETWSVSLNLKGRLSSISIGSTRDDVEASIVAARISTFMGKKVRSL